MHYLYRKLYLLNMTVNQTFSCSLVWINNVEYNFQMVESTAIWIYRHLFKKLYTSRNSIRKACSFYCSEEDCLFVGDECVLVRVSLRTKAKDLVKVLTGDGLFFQTGARLEFSDELEENILNFLDVSFSLIACLAILSNYAFGWHCYSYKYKGERIMFCVFCNSQTG